VLFLSSIHFILTAEMIFVAVSRVYYTEGLNG